MLNFIAADAQERYVMEVNIVDVIAYQLDISAHVCDVLPARFQDLAYCVVARLKAAE